MRERPKQASYVEKHIQARQNPSHIVNSSYIHGDNNRMDEGYTRASSSPRPTRQSAVPSKSNPVKSKTKESSDDMKIVPQKPSGPQAKIGHGRIRSETVGKTKAPSTSKGGNDGSQEGGKMIQYLSIDDIPDGEPLSPSSLNMKPSTKAGAKIIPNQNVPRIIAPSSHINSQQRQLQQYQQQHALYAEEEEGYGNDHDDDYDDGGGSDGDSYYRPPSTNRSSKPAQYPASTSNSRESPRAIQQSMHDRNSKISAYAKYGQDDEEDDWNDQDEVEEEVHVMYKDGKVRPGSNHDAKAPLPAFPAEQGRVISKGPEPRQISQRQQVQQLPPQQQQSPTSKGISMSKAKQRSPKTEANVMSRIKPEPVVYSTPNPVSSRNDNYGQGYPASSKPAARQVQCQVAKPQPQRQVPTQAVQSQPQPSGGRQPFQQGQVVSGESQSTGYKPYTLEQYRQIKPKEYHEIPQIKPDLMREDLVAKRANLERIREFSKQLQEYNTQVAQQQRKLPAASEMKDMAVAKSKLDSKRERALQFAKQVPKPAVVSKSSEVQSDDHAGRDRDRDTSFDHEDSMGDYGGDENMVACFDDTMYESTPQMGRSVVHQSEPSRLELLQAKHAQSKRQVDAIKASLGMK